MLGKYYIGNTGISKDVLGMTPSSYPLDDFSDAEVAYSFRRLRSDYTGSVVKLKRTYDNATLDFGFASGSDYLDTASADSWCGVGGGVCSIDAWYDQSTNGRGLDGGLYQPDFINSSDLTSKKGISFNGSDDTLQWNTGAGTAMFFSTQSTEIVVFSGGYTIMAENGATTSARGIEWRSNNITTTPSASASVGFTTNNTSSIVGGILDDTTFTAYANGQKQGSSAITSGAISGMDWYGGQIGDYSSGVHYEYIRWNKVLPEYSLLKTMNNINTFYNTPNYI